MILDRKQRISLRKIIFKRKITKIFFHFRKSDPLRIKNKFKKLRTMTQNQFNFRPAKQKLRRKKCVPFLYVFIETCPCIGLFFFSDLKLYKKKYEFEKQGPFEKKNGFSKSY